MPLLPALEPFLASVSEPSPDSSVTSVADARAAAHALIDHSLSALSQPAPAVVGELDRRILVDGGSIVVRVYRPSWGSGRPLHVYVHGGGFWTGTLDQSDSVCRRIAQEVDCVVVSLAYRLSPEAKFPVPVEDCYQALCWVADHGEYLGGDSARISIGGVSAGGGLAAATALMARDRGGPSLCHQVLELPVTDLTMSQPSIDENAAGPLLTRDGLAACVNHFLADPADATNPYASPLLAPRLSELPSALVMTAELDPLRDEGEAYARRLADAGVAVEVRRWDGFFHGAQTMDRLIPGEAAIYHAVVVASLRRAHNVGRQAAL